MEAELCVKMHPLGAAEENGLIPLRGEGVGHLDDEPPADPLAPESFGGLAAGHVGLPVAKGVGSHRADDVPALLQGPDQCLAPAALGAELRVKIIPPGRPVREQIFRHRAGSRIFHKGQAVPESFLRLGLGWQGQLFPRRKAEDGVVTRLLPAHRGRAQGLV